MMSSLSFSVKKVEKIAANACIYEYTFMSAL